MKLSLTFCFALLSFIAVCQSAPGKPEKYDRNDVLVETKQALINAINSVRAYFPALGLETPIPDETAGKIKYLRNAYYRILQSSLFFTHYLVSVVQVEFYDYSPEKLAREIYSQAEKLDSAFNECDKNEAKGPFSKSPCKNLKKVIHNFNSNHLLGRLAAMLDVQAFDNVVKALKGYLQFQKPKPAPTHGGGGMDASTIMALGQLFAL